MEIAIVLPAYNASNTLKLTLDEIPTQYMKGIILVDDNSSDDTALLARKYNIPHIILHKQNKGYGGNQKTCYNYALGLDPKYIIMLHPDFQYSPKHIPEMIDVLQSGQSDVVLGSRIMMGNAASFGMPIYKLICNKLLTFFQNKVTGLKLTEYHTGYRAYKASVLRTLNYNSNSDNFIFDNQILCQIINKQYTIREISTPSRYMSDSSSISFFNSIIYGIGVIYINIRLLFHKKKILSYHLFD